MSHYTTRTARKHWTCADCGAPIPRGTTYTEYKTEEMDPFKAGTRLCTDCAERRQGPTIEDDEAIAGLRRILAELASC